MTRLRPILLALTCIVFSFPQLSAADSLQPRSVVLNHPITFPGPGGAQAVVPPGVYHLEPESDSLLRLVSARGGGVVSIEAVRIAHRMPVPEPIALTRSEGEAFRMALLFPDGHGLEAVGTIARVGTRDVSGTTTVSLDRRTHFTAPDGADVVAGPGTYRVEAVTPLLLTLVPMETEKEALTVQALSTSHQESLSMPIATLVPEDGNAVHLLYLLPGGAALDAIGSASEVRSRAPVEPLNAGKISALVLKPTPGTTPSTPTSSPQPGAVIAQTRNKVVLTPDTGPSGIVVQVSACGLQGPAGTPFRVRLSGLGAPDQELTPVPCANGGYGFGQGTSLPPVPMKVQSILGGNSVAVDLLGPNSSTPIERSVGFFSVIPSAAVGKITSLQVRTDFFAGFYDQCPVHSHVIVTLDSQGQTKFGIAAKSDMAETLTQVLQDAWGHDRTVRISYAHNDFLTCRPTNPILGVEAIK